MSVLPPTASSGGPSLLSASLQVRCLSALRSWKLHSGRHLRGGSWAVCVARQAGDMGEDKAQGFSSRGTFLLLTPHTPWLVTSALSQRPHPKSWGYTIESKAVCREEASSGRSGQKIPTACSPSSRPASAYPVVPRRKDRRWGETQRGDARLEVLEGWEHGPSAAFPSSSLSRQVHKQAGARGKHQSRMASY